jgi:amidase
VADLHELGAVEQATLVRRREVSPVELVEHYLARIEQRSAEVGAFVTVTPDVARAQARAAEAAPGTADDLSPLHGVPIAIKDLTRTAGVRTTFGSAAFTDAVADIDDHVVTRLRAGGTAMLGKTSTPEFGLPCYTEPDVAPPARTPWDLSLSASGSSGGAAAAVAAGLVPLAHGNDGGGSVRTPASVCGLVGFKPSRGRVSNGPRSADVAMLACHGVLARTVADAAAFLDVTAGPAVGDPWWAPPLPPGETFLEHARRAPVPLRIGRFMTPVLADVVPHPAVVAAFEGTGELLEALGHHVEDVPCPFDPGVVPHFEAMWAAGAAAMPITSEAELRLRPLTRWTRAQGQVLSGRQLMAALMAARLAAHDALVAMSGYDAVLVPTLADLPQPVGGIRNDDDPAADFEAQKAFSPYCAPFNITGQPAISLPLHWTDEALPVGVQLVGRPAGEGLLLSLAAQLEAARPWRDRRPDIW